MQAVNLRRTLQLLTHKIVLAFACVIATRKLSGQNAMHAVRRINSDSTGMSMACSGIGGALSVSCIKAAHLRLKQLPTSFGCQTDLTKLEVSCLSVAVLSTQASVTWSRALQYLLKISSQVPSSPMNVDVHRAAMLSSTSPCRQMALDCEGRLARQCSHCLDCAETGLPAQRMRAAWQKALV